ncbi:MAG: signal peptidase II [Syntrophobacteraceae bacterium]
MKRAKRIFFAYMIILLCIGADQLTKQIVRTDMPKTKSIVLITGVLKLDYADNRGGVFAFELLLPRKWRGETVSGAAALLLGLCILFLTFSQRLPLLCFSGIALFCGGSLSNLIDRVAFGRVIDFVNFSAPGLQPYIFNLADVAIATGITLALLSVVIQLLRMVLL